jgi:cobalt transporter subunit CbtB
MRMQSNSKHIETQATALSSVGRRALWAPLAAAFLGALIVWVVGFSHVEAIHNAAHDTRHSQGFPCH